MKKLLIATNVLLLSVILFQAFNQVDNSKSKSVRPISCPNKICCDYSDTEPPGLINENLAKLMSENYSRDVGKSHIGSTTQPDALYVSFELEKIKNLIWHIEHAICLAKCDTSKIKLGIRFYFAKYPPNTGKPDGPLQLRDLSTECANKHTLFMIPEYQKNIDKIWHDFNYNNMPPSACRIKEIPSNPYKPKIQPLMITNTGEGDNHGGIGPPPKPGTYGTN